MARRLSMEVGALSDIGCVRESNEDAYGLAPELNLFLVSDGMGGLAFGEVASRLAVDTVLDNCRRANTGGTFPHNGEATQGVSEVSNRLASAVRAANETVHRAAVENGAGQQMGATVVAVQFSAEIMSLAHVGDSRAYRLRAGALEQLTHDHSFVAEQMRRGRMTPHEAGCSTLQNILVRALGIEPAVEVDVSEELFMEGDTVLLCSDGLTRELSDMQIAAVLSENADVQKTAGRLVDLAKQAGGGDNITAIVLRHAPRSAGAFAWIRKWFRSDA